MTELLYCPMGEYTLQVGKIGRERIFNFKYPFYNEELKEQFEEKFMLEFRFEEIGTETIGRFCWELQSILVNNYPKYLHLYKAYLKSQELAWWNNKDYKYQEEFKSLNTNNNTNNINTKSDSNSKASSDSTNKTNGLSKYAETPQGRVENMDKYFTNGTTDSSSSSSQDITNTSNNDSTSTIGTSNNINNGTYSKTIREEGNIGTTSSADLIKSWITDGLVDVDRVIFEDCKDLFMQIYY